MKAATQMSKMEPDSAAAPAENTGRHTLPRVTIGNTLQTKVRPWFVLLVGFGGLLLLMAAAGTDAVLVLSNLRESDAQVRERFLTRSRALEQIRSEIYLSGTFVRDYLLAPERSGAQAQRARLEQLQQETEATLGRYGRSLDAAEEQAFQDLRSEIAAYWKVLDRTFEWTAEERARKKYSFFYEELIPRRTAMLQIADRVMAINEREMNRSDSKLAETFGRFRWGLIATITVALIGGAVLSALTILYVLRLERELRSRLTETAEAQVGLKELSAKLVRAQEDERRALSRELHDEVGQSFSAILMETENLLDSDAPVSHPHLDSIRDLAMKGVEVVRNMTLLLRPSMLDDFGLVPALNWQARETAKRTGLKINLTATNVSEDLPEEHKTCIYRIVQETLNNAARHAQARAVHVCLEGYTGKILVRVEDDGTGFDTRWVRGLGILGMEERVKHLGGVFDIESRPGLGTAVNVELPVAGVLPNGNGNGASHSHSAG